jgi:carbamate kinase
VLVDRGDPALSNPTKPIGRSRATPGASLAYRGKRITELDIIKSLISQGRIVISCGGGGIPVVESAESDLVSLEAVIDKDSAALNPRACL